MHIIILTLFPEVIQPFINSSIIKRAVAKKQVQFSLISWRSFTSDKHQTVDDRPYGGGPGMLLKIEPLVYAIEHTEKKLGQCHKILLSPQGKLYDQRQAGHYASLLQSQNIMLICGHYEGFDARILAFVDSELSIGQYVLGGGESAAMVVVDSLVRLIPGVLKKPEAILDESFMYNNNEILEYPQYTKPVEFRGLKVPAVLTQGNHQKIAKWRIEHSGKKKK